jgi:hypothetical protein
MILAVLIAAVPSGMVPDDGGADEVPFPALLRGARATYGAAVQEALSRAGSDDLPRNGSFVIGAIDRTGAPPSRISAGLGVCKQTAELVGGMAPEDRPWGIYESALSDPDETLVGVGGPSRLRQRPRLKAPSSAR